MAQLQTQLIEIKERLWPDPKINWRNLSNAQQAHLRVSQEIKKIEQKRERLHSVFHKEKKQLTQLKQEHQVLIQQLWAIATNL